MPQTVERKGRDDLVAAVRAERGSLTPKLRAIASYALDHPERFVRTSNRDLCAAIGTSEPTLIRFCRHFGYAGQSDFRIDFALDHARGGLTEPPARDRRRENVDAKRAIARAAVALVAEDRSLLIDNGSTAEVFAAALDAVPPKTIMTTGLPVAHAALSHGSHEVMLTGGMIHADALALTGRLVETALAEMRFDTFVMGAGSVDPARGLSTFREDEAHATRAMIGAAARVIVLADRTKFTKPRLHHICGLDRVAAVVTDLPPGSGLHRDLDAVGVRVVLAGGRV